MISQKSGDKYQPISYEKLACFFTFGKLPANHPGKASDNLRDESLQRSHKTRTSQRAVDSTTNIKWLQYSFDVYIHTYSYIYSRISEPSRVCDLISLFEVFIGSMVTWNYISQANSDKTSSCFCLWLYCRPQCKSSLIVSADAQGPPRMGPLAHMGSLP